MNVAKFLKRRFRRIRQFLTATADTNQNTIANVARTVVVACSKRCQTMKYDDWTDTELRMLLHIQGLNRMQLDEYLGGLGKNGKL